ncbi:hypothetical protein GCM10010218_40480 [Streptomyces mashuensis]|uniref:Secreted protein n=1 Tax=Streptomyces mashuensis TaxID=33904 RepID=A0A919B6A8_9ACTN|nr:peptidase inhibitor family I36 protein [Streptomyces mashuensis]GHF55026.1 hypothetical protein GCM10010218_40480 [Streptomyces mashuensis]
MSAAAVLFMGAVAALPAQAARAGAVPICPTVVGLCTWPEPNAEGGARMLQRPEPRLVPVVRSAKNQTSRKWCLYPKPSYGGEPFVLHPAFYTPGLGLEARSARPCPDPQPKPRPSPKQVRPAGPR